MGLENVRQADSKEVERSEDLNRSLVHWDAGVGTAVCSAA
jgi:hypothetical protein